LGGACQQHGHSDCDRASRYQRRRFLNPLPHLCRQVEFLNSSSPFLLSRSSRLWNINPHPLHRQNSIHLSTTQRRSTRPRSTCNRGVSLITTGRDCRARSSATLLDTQTTLRRFLQCLKRPRRSLRRSTPQFTHQINTRLLVVVPLKIANLAMALQ